MIDNIGYGKITPLQIIRKLTPKTEEEQSDIELEKITSKEAVKPKTGVTVKGLNDILVRFAKCCQPVPGDPITGYITRGRGVTIHRTTCINAMKMNPDLQIDVQWHENSTETYPVKIHIRSQDRVGLLADLAANISKHGANILHASSDIRDDKTVDSIFTLAVKDTVQLNKVITAIRKVKLILRVRRIDT